MISVKELNKHTYPGTKFFLDKKKNLWLDLNIERDGKKINPVKLGTMEEISSDNYKTRPLFEIKKTVSAYNFLKNSLPNLIKVRNEALARHIKQYPNAQSFKNKLPPEVKLGPKKDLKDLVINSNNKIVKQNINNLNKYLFNFISDLATGNIDIDSRVMPKDLLKILNKKRPISQFYHKRERQFVLRSEVNTLAKDFNEHLNVLVKNEKFLNFIRDNKSSLHSIINTQNKDRTKLIELAEERLAGRKKLKELKVDAFKQYNENMLYVAENILSIALNKANKKEKTMLNILGGIAAAAKAKEGRS